MTRTLFDRYVVVDWSARNQPALGRDSIWIATVDRHDPSRPSGDDAPTARRWNPPTRRRAERDLGALLDDAAGVRTLLAIDVGLGYPAGTAAHLGLTGVAWRAVWSQISSSATDDDRNRNNRFDVATMLNARTDGPGPFWGCPPARRSASLEPTKPAAPRLAEFRSTERALRAAGRHPKSMWQLLGNGSVGSQSLTAIPVLDRMLRDRPSTWVWPLSTGLDLPELEPGAVVVAEVWPSQFDVVVGDGEVRDAAQVSEVARHLRTADHDGELAGWFRPPVPSGDRSVVVEEEGWVLGPPRPDRRPTDR